MPSPRPRRRALTGCIESRRGRRSRLGARRRSARDQMGNSEVGHLNIGAGRIVEQDIVRTRPKRSPRHELKERILCSSMPSGRGRRFTFAGLLSDGGVHSMQSHLHGLIDAAISLGPSIVQDVFVHAILDGRDTPPKSAEKYLAIFSRTSTENRMHTWPPSIGRYFTMDRR